MSDENTVWEDNTPETENLPKREIIARLIEAGNATKETLLEGAETTVKGLSTQFNYLRLTGRYPVANEEGIFRLVDAETWSAIKAERKAAAAAKKKGLTPEARVEKAEARVDRAIKAFNSISESVSAHPENELYKLMLTKADLECKIADMILEMAQEAIQ